MEQRIHFRLKELLREEFFGDFASRKIGFEGFELEHVRPFFPGDPPEALDQRLSARRGKPMVKVTNPDKGVTAHFVCDLSRSMGLKRKSVLTVVEVLLEHLASVNAQSACAIFSQEVEYEITSGCGLVHNDAILQAVRSFVPHGATTSYQSVAALLRRIPRAPRLVFLITDLLVSPAEVNYLRAPSFLHDMVCCIIRHPTEISQKRRLFGEVTFADAETGRQATGTIAGAPDPATLLENSKIDWSEFLTTDSPNAILEKLIELFEKRKERREGQ